MPSHSPDGFTVFPSARSIDSYERKVLADDEHRFQTFLDSVSDEPAVREWLDAIAEAMSRESA